MNRQAKKKRAHMIVDRNDYIVTVFDGVAEHRVGRRRRFDFASDAEEWAVSQNLLDYRIRLLQPWVKGGYA